jgi:hypothetical protein
MKMLVIGTNDFVDSALCPHLLPHVHEVVSAVRRPSGITSERIVHDESFGIASLEE